jgi:ABC-type transport system involved in cytochrome bd biosynthesis fused ATPase/permease subunit
VTGRDQLKKDGDRKMGTVGVCRRDASATLVAQSQPKALITIIGATGSGKNPPGPLIVQFLATTETNSFADSVSVETFSRARLSESIKALRSRGLQAAVRRYQLRKSCCRFDRQLASS